MPRKKTKDLIRDLPADRRYNSVLVQRLINKVMLAGKKQLAERIVYEAMAQAAKELKSDDALEVLTKALENIRPTIETRSRRIGGANYQIPFEVKGQRQTHLMLNWLIQAARGRQGQPMAARLANEIVAAYNESGEAVKKRTDVQKMAESNRAFAHMAR